MRLNLGEEKEKNLPIQFLGPAAYDVGLLTCLIFAESSLGPGARGNGGGKE